MNNKLLLILLLFLVIVLLGCKKQQIVQEPVQHIEEQKPAETPTLPLGNPEVKVFKKEFVPNSISAKIGQEITWVNRDENPHFIACYEKTNRIFIGEKFLAGQDYRKSFDRAGNFWCLDTIYGARMNVSIS